MTTIRILLQIVVGLGILNVWLVRANWQTSYRGGAAQNLREEFATYGLPTWSFYLIGFLKICCALGLLAGILIPSLVTPAALGLALLMSGAFAMHMKVKDHFSKAWPSLVMLLLCVTIAVL